MGDMTDYFMDSFFIDAAEVDGFYEDGPYYPIKLQRGRGKCPKCGAETRPIMGRYGLFFGCIVFPKCNGSRPYI